MTKFSLAVIYWILGIALSFSIGIFISGVVGAFRSLLNLFASRTAWLATLSFLLVAYIAANFAVGTLGLAGNLGDRTNYRMQSALLVGAVFPGIFTWLMTIGVTAAFSKELALSPSFRPYGVLYGRLIFYVCGFLGASIVFAFISSTWSPPMTLLSLLLYPFTFVIAPIVMIFNPGTWWPLLLHLGGFALGGMAIRFGQASESSPTAKTSDELIADLAKQVEKHK